MTGTMTGMANMKLPKYIRNRSGTYHYQRDFPTSLKHLSQTNSFTHPLKLFANNATEMQIAKAAIEAQEAYERQIKLISNSDPDALSATELEKAAAHFLRRRSLNRGQFVKVGKDPHITAQEEATKTQLQVHEYNHADWAIPEFEDVLEKQAREIPLTAQDKVVGEAYMSLITKAQDKPQTLGSLWTEYAEHRDIDPSSRNDKKAIKHWNNWLSLAGDTIISKNTKAHINNGIEAYVRERTGKVSSQTIRRELNDITACLRMGELRYDWRIKLPRIKETKPKSRHPLEPYQQIALVRAILDHKGTINPKYGAAMLLCLQGGMMQSEIRRLQPEDIGLDSETPHLSIRNKTKNEDRERIVPIVLGLDLIRHNLNDTIKWLNCVTEATPSATLKKIMRRTIDSTTTSPHCLRHTLKINAQGAGVPTLSISSIAGWSDPERRLSKHVTRYGSKGIGQDTVTKGLYKDSRKIHKHLIEVELEMNSSNSNIIPFKRQHSD
jgi:integrase